MAHNSYTMCIRGLPDMYTLSPRASDVHIRQTTHAHGITITYIYIVYIYILYIYIVYIYCIYIYIVYIYCIYILCIYISLSTIVLIVGIGQKSYGFQKFRTLKSTLK